ncbi:hypothetical protein [Methanofollis sp. W23]|uniref:hypothetical protein n=1 Tax=Methanofollis sp. W23 TaxID=2817849 RepID=UPI001AE4D1F9|nr:hypothetical protein [Methanofollis sp. W23]
MMLRMVIEGATVGRLRLTFHERESRTGPLMSRLPTCEDLIQCVDRDFGFVEG